MIREILIRGLRTTRHLMGGWTSLIFLVPVPVISFVLHWLRSGQTAMTAEIEVWLVNGLMASGLTFLLIFLGSLFFAPFQIERERRIDAESESNRLREKLGNQGWKYQDQSVADLAGQAYHLLQYAKKEVPAHLQGNSIREPLGGLLNSNHVVWALDKPRQARSEYARIIRILWDADAERFYDRPAFNDKKEAAQKAYSTLEEALRRARY